MDIWYLYFQQSMSGIAVKAVYFYAGYRAVLVFKSFYEQELFVIFACSVFLAADSVEMKSSRTFIRGNRCIERER